MGLANKNLYKTSIGGMGLRLPELQKLNLEIQKLRFKKQLSDT